MGDKIHGRYQELVEEAKLNSKGLSLKTDCWQEANDFNPIKVDYYCELYQELVDKAKAKGYNVVQGDIRNLPFEDETFGLLVDTSTIDHIPDYEKALKEYYRVVKRGGNLLLVTWVLLKDEDFLSNEDSYGNPQYYFAYEKFKENLKKYFIIEQHAFFNYKNNCGILTWFKCKKPN